MEFSRPPLQEIVTRIQSDLASRVGVKLPLKKVSILSALSFALAGAVHLLYGRIEYLISQFTNPSGKFLEIFSFFFGIKRRGKSAASVTVRLTGTPGKTIPKDALLSHPDGRIYQLTSDCTLGDTGFSFCRVMAQDLGPTGNLKPLDVLTLVGAIPNVNSTAQVLTDHLQCGFDEEEDDELRSRLFSRLRHPGQGGSKNDYIQWAKEVVGVGQVWIDSDPHTLRVFVTFLTSDADYPIPTSSHLKQVSDVLLKRKPLGTRVAAYELTPLSIPVEILLPEEILPFKPRIEAALKNYFLNQISPGEMISAFVLSQVISKATRNLNFKISLPNTDIQISPGQIAVFGGLTCKTSTSF